MTLPSVQLQYPGQPCNNRRIRSIERQIKRALPKDYAEFIKATGGGILSQENCVFDGMRLPTGDISDSRVETIFGNGTASNGADIDLVTYAGFLAEEWEIPTEVLLIGHAESGMHECFVINYELNTFPPHSVLYIDNENDDGFLLIAETFSEFLLKLQPSPDHTETPRTPYDGQEGVHAAQQGHIGDTLTEAIKACSVPDMEQIIRRAAEPLAKGNRIRMYVTEDAFRFQDILFYLTQPLADHYGLDTWKEIIPERPNRFRAAGLLEGSFVSSTGYSAVDFYEDSMDTWWKNRTENGVLVETLKGYKLKEDYVEWLIDSFR